MGKIDLHTHSNVSDGSCTPRELIRLAQSAGLAGIALTDHDTVAGVAEAAAEAKACDICFLPGMEMTVRYRESQLHIVALGFEMRHPSFRRMYARIRALKEADMEEVIEAVRRRGADISRERVMPFCRGGALDRYALMRYFVSLRLFDDVQDIWDQYLNPALRVYSDNIAAEEALQAIKEAGGVTSLAHFHKRLGLAGLSRAEQEDVILELAAMGLDGMERYYPNYTVKDQDFAAYMIDRYRLLATGGTDFHGKNRPAVALGTGIEDNMAIPDEIFAGVLARSRAAGTKRTGNQPLA